MRKEIQCVVCNSIMIATNGDQARRKYCSDRCRHRFNNRNNKGKQNFCLDCNKQINLNSKRCGSCNTKHLNYVGERNPRYTNGISGGYIQRLSEEAVIKSGRRIDLCEKCGKTGISHKEILIHHKDRDRTNNKAENLKVLCGSCHTKTHYKDYQVEIECKWCNKKFMSNSKRHIFCSKRCCSLSYYKKNRIKLRKYCNNWYKNKQGEIK